ncbi:MAG: phasin family protein [Pseudomonadota bacterium]|nr:phasin family protein [Pseudomonadota bacterium]
MATATKKSAPKRAAKPAETTAEAAQAFSNTARDQFDTLLAAYNDQAETFRSQTEELMETVRGNFETAQTRFQSVNADLMSAAREEMAEAVDFANELARAKTFADALEIQRGYWTNLFQTRVERTRELTNATVEAARESFEPFSKSLGSAFAPTAAFEKFFPFAAK